MQKKTHDYDNVFKTMKSKHKRLFISVINDIFGRDYPMDTKVEVLPSEGYLTEAEMPDGSIGIEGQVVKIMGGVIIETESEKLIRKGVRQSLVQQICKKLQKNKTVEVIAEELEEELAEVKKVIAAQQRVGNYNVEEICKMLESQEFNI